MTTRGHHGLLLNYQSPGDPDWANVIALLPMTGDNNATTFIDLTGRGWSAQGNAKISTAQSKFGGGAGVFDGSGDYVDTPDSNDWDFGAGMFTIEAFVRFNTAATNSTVLSQWGTTAGTAAWAFYLDTGILYFRFYDTGAVLRDTSVAWAPAANTWYHLCAERNASGVVRVYVNGVVVATQTRGQTMRTSTALPRFGAVQGFSTFDLNGYAGWLRVTKGVARYNGAFTPPSEPYPAGPPSAPILYGLAGLVDS
jgi:hypothetical protein